MTKVFLLLSILWTAATTTLARDQESFLRSSDAEQNRELWWHSSCPSVPGSCTCSHNYSPVWCGSSQCKYENHCQAMSAGWNSYDCHSESGGSSYTCPSVHGWNWCSSRSKPVYCGSHNCEYKNRCMAKSAGWSNNECTYPTSPPWSPPTSAPISAPTCPQVGLCDHCSSTYKPVYCGSEMCEYDNECKAVSAGWQGSECEMRCPYVDKWNQCGSDYSYPVVCEGCEYESICLAESAGYSKSCCKEKSSCDSYCHCYSGESCSCNGCAMPQGGSSCQTSNDYPVVCSNNCAYKHSCMAYECGMHQSQCVEMGGSW